MDRFETMVTVIAAARRDRILADCASGATDADLAEEDKPTRAEVSPGCLLKFNDDVLVYGMTVRVLCPGRGVGWFYGLTLEEQGFVLGSFDALTVEDRAPVDPNETPMPIFGDPPT